MYRLYLHIPFLFYDSQGFFLFLPTLLYEVTNYDFPLEIGIQADWCIWAVGMHGWKG